MTKGQIIDRLNAMGYKTVVGHNEIIVENDNNHKRYFYNWQDVKSYYNIEYPIATHNELLYIANSVFNSLLTGLNYKNELDIEDEKTIENIMDKSINIAKMLIDKCK